MGPSCLLAFVLLSFAWEGPSTSSSVVHEASQRGGVGWGGGLKLVGNSCPQAPSFCGGSAGLGWEVPTQLSPSLGLEVAGGRGRRELGGPPPLGGTLTFDRL